MTHPYLANATAWGFALRTLMGYPQHALPFHTTTWCTSGVLDIDQVMNLKQLAADKCADLVHIAFEFESDEPLAISLFVRREHGIEWMPNVLPYAAGENAKIELLADRQRWLIGPRQSLTAARRPPKAQWERGVAMARRRWREVAAQVEPPQLDGSVWVPSGGRYADAIPHKALNIAA